MELYGSLVANKGGGGGGGTVDVPIKSISVNGSGVAPVNKNVNIDVPTKVSELENDSNFASTNDIPTKTSQLTNDSSFVTESDLTAKNYADKTYVGEQIAQSEHLKRKFVTVLPEPSVADEHTIYMLKDESVQGDDKYKEYMLIEGVVQCVGDTSVDLTDYVKTNELPTELPANGGNADTVNNHTVESNVPVDAKFTDTVYNDTNIKYGEVAGGKNLFKGNFIEKVLDTGINYTDVDLSKEQNTIKDIKGIVFAVFGAYLKKGTYTFSYTNDAYFSLNRVAIAGTDCVLAIESIRKSYTWTQNTDGWTYFGIEGDDSETGVTDTPFSVTPDIQIEKGAQATAYETYIPSIKMLEDEVSEQNESLSVIGKCKNLLKPTLQTTTKNGVTITNNGDGTYTLNGTATDGTFFDINKNISINKGTKYKAVCFKDEDYVPNKIMSCVRRVDIENGYVSNNGSFVSDTENCWLWIKIEKDVTVSNLVAKPMITTDLNATYDDFVPYIGDGETLTHDVAEIKNDLANFTSGLYIDGDTDWNTIKTSGMYFYNGWSGSGGSNKPTETKSIGMAFVLNSGIKLLQFVVLESGNSYFRSGTVDELGNWTTIS